MPVSKGAQDGPNRPPSGSKRRKGSGLSLSHLKSPFKFIGSNKPSCLTCGKKCSGQVVKVNDAHFCVQCFKCAACKANLSTGGFFTKEEKHYCTNCYQKEFGTKCGKCGKYVEGEVVSALGQTFCQQCFTCGSCERAFGVGEKVTFNGHQCICQRCAEQLDRCESANGGSSESLKPFSVPKASSVVCSVCSQDLTNGHALEALDKHFHLYCFRCSACKKLLHGEYMGKEGRPYCEQCYQTHFGVKCTYCRLYISGKVLQAGEKNHFHPSCARCSKCGEAFSDGEDMFLQGAAIWHPTCGPGPDHQPMIDNGSEFAQSELHQSHGLDDNVSIGSHNYPSRSSTPGLRSRSIADTHRASFSRSTAQLPPSYPYGGSSRLYNSNSTYSLRRPIEAGSRTGSVSGRQHFHLPPSRQPSLNAVGQASKSWAMSSSRSLLSSRVPSRSASREQDSLSLAPSNRATSCPPPKPGGNSNKSFSLTPNIRLGNRRKNNAMDDMDGSTFKMNGSSMGKMGMGSESALVRSNGLEAHKAYPMHLLLTTNYKLPLDVDRCNLEMHLTDDDFQTAFRMARDKFYALPLWRRNDLKRRLCLF